MSSRSGMSRWGITALVAGLALMAACSKSTSPAASGGGGTPLELNSPTLASGGGVYAHLFATAGMFPYHCKIHGLSMSGTITVSAAGAATDQAVSIVTSAFPSAPAIKPGQTVTWTNNSPNQHTVTSN